jgi:hypothetical protein
LKNLSDAFELLTRVRQSKIIQATKMEKAMEKAYHQARMARLAAAEQKKKDASKFPPPESDSEGLGLMPKDIDPGLLEQVQEKLLKLEKERNAGKRSNKVAEPEEAPEDE